MVHRTALWPPFRCVMSLFAAVLFIVCGCGTKEPIIIGFLGGLSGRGGDLGAAARNGVMLAVEQCNRKGGIRGRSLNLLAWDDHQDPETAKKAIDVLLEKKVKVIIGPMTSNMAMATVPLINRSNTILVSPTVTTKALAGKDDNFIRVIGITRKYAVKNAQYNYKKMGHRRGVAFYDLKNRAYTQSWYEDFKDAFEALGGTMLPEKRFQSGAKISFNDMVADLPKLHPDFVLIIANAVDAALICQQVRKLDGKMAISLSEWASTERFIELAGRASENVCGAQFIDRNSISVPYREFYSGYKERFDDEPGFAGVAGYDAAMVVIEALGRRKANETLKESIIGIGTFQCLQQTIRIDRFGDAERAFFLSVVKNGHFQTLE